jgi:hypothetical protein
VEKSPLRLGPLLQVQPEEERFLNRADANAFLQREYRKQFVLPLT